jgi:hypothetical protein
MPPPPPAAAPAAPAPRDAVANRASVKKYYEANKENILKQRITLRIRKGAIPQRDKLSAFGLTVAEVNLIRRSVGLAAVDYEAFPLRPRAAAPATPAASTSRSPPQAPAASTRTTRSTRTTAAAPTTNLTVDSIAKDIAGLGGRVVKLMADGQQHKEGHILGVSTASQYAGSFRRIARLVGLSAHDDPMPVLRDHARVSAAIVDGRAGKVNTLKSDFNILVSAAKYLPSFKEALGPEALASYNGDMHLNLATSKRQEVERTASDAAAIPSIQTIRDKVIDIKIKFAPTDKRYIAALLQSSVVGLRDNLGDVKLDDESADRFYIPSTRRLVIKRFKTAHLGFEPYDVTLSNEVGDAVDAYLAKHPRQKTLLGGGKLGPTISSTFKAVGLKVGVMTIRHAMETDMLTRGGASAANVEQVARQFKHGPEMALRYFRVLASAPAAVYADDAE